MPTRFPSRVYDFVLHGLTYAFETKHSSVPPRWSHSGKNESLWHPVFPDSVFVMACFVDLAAGEADQDPRQRNSALQLRDVSYAGSRGAAVGPIRRAVLAQDHGRANLTLREIILERHGRVDQGVNRPRLAWLYVHLYTNTEASEQVHPS